MSERLIDRLKAAAAAQKVKVLDVDVWVSPLTLAEQAKCAAMYPNDSALREAAILAMKCLDSEGKPIFTADDRETLANEVGSGAFTAAWMVINGRSVEQIAEK